MDSASLTWATAIVLVLYAGVILFFVVRGARRTRSMRDYALGNVTFSPWFVGLSLAAASTSAATFIINPGFIALYGWSAFLAFAVFLPLGKYLSLILMTKRFRRQGVTVKALSMAQWIGNRYDSKGFALFFAVLSLLLITFMVLICVGMTKVLSQALHIGEMTALAGIVVFVFGYMMFGGANSMVYTNTVQAFLKLLVAIILIGSGYKYMSAGPDDFWRQVAAIDPALTASVNPGSPLFRDYFEIIFCPFIVGIAIVCQPHIITKSLLLKKDSDVNKYLTAGILAEIIFFSVVIAGLYARLAFPDLQAGGTALKMDGIMPAYVVREFTIWTALIIIIGLISSGLATFEGLIQSLSTTVTTDILDTIWGKKISKNDEIRQRKLHFINKIVIVGLAITTFLLARNQLLHPKLSVGIFAQLGVYGFFSTAFVPVLFGIFLKNTPRIAPIAASVTAVVVHFSVYYGGLTPYTSGAVRNPAVASALAILSSVAVGTMLHILLRKSQNVLKPVAVATLLLSGWLSGAAIAQTTTVKRMQDIAYPSDTKKVALPGGVEIAYIDRGAGPVTLVFVHGLGANLKAWQKNVDSLSRDYRCIALDLPGYGKSGQGDYAYGMSFFAEQLRAFLEVLNLKNVVLAGHSMGGQIALTAALQDTARLKKLVLIAPAGIETFTDAEKNWFQAVYTPEVVKNTGVEQIRRNFSVNFFQWPADAEFMYQDRLLLRETAEWDAWCRMVPQCVSGMLNEPVFDRLGQITLPTLVLFGENDYLIPNKILHKDQSTQQIAQLAQSKIPGSRLKMLQACGHFAQWEQAALTNSAIREFLAD